MTSVVATITMSLDGYITGPNDAPGRGLGEGGERLHYWVFGGPWTYDTEKLGAATGKDKEHLDRMMSSGGAVVGGRGTYDAAEAWGGTNPWPVPFFIVTHHPEDEPAGKGIHVRERSRRGHPASAGGSRREERPHHGWGGRDPPGAARGSPRRGLDHHRARRAWRRQAPLRRIR